MKHLDWGPNTSAPYALTRSPHYLWYKETKRPSLICFGKADSDSRTVRTKIITEITYGLCFGHCLFGWKAKRITFPMELVSYSLGNVKTMRHIKSVREASSILCHGMKLAILGNLSTSTKMLSRPLLVLCKPNTKSIEISSQGTLGTYRGIYKPCGFSRDLAF
jgi:hypothetical protein